MHQLNLVCKDKRMTRYIVLIALFALFGSGTAISEDKDRVDETKPFTAKQQEAFDSLNESFLNLLKMANHDFGPCTDTEYLDVISLVLVDDSHPCVIWAYDKYMPKKTEVTKTKNQSFEYNVKVKVEPEKKDGKIQWTYVDP